MKLSVIMRRAIRNPHTKELGAALKARLRLIWVAPPDLSVEDPYKWQRLIATSGLNGRDSEEAWNKLFTKLSEL